MQTYDAELILGGTPVTNTAIKKGLTAAEILVLRALHGENAVTDIKPRSMDRRSHAEERARLEEIYGPADEGAGGKAIVMLFGPPGAGGRLPLKLDMGEVAEEAAANADAEFEAMMQPPPAKAPLTLKG